MQIPAVTSTNYVVNPSFEYPALTPYQSPLQISVRDSTQTTELPMVNSTANSIAVEGQAIVVTESVSAQLITAAFSPVLKDSAAIGEQIDIALYTNESMVGWYLGPVPYVSSLSLSVSDSTRTTEHRSVQIAATFSPLVKDYPATAESVQVILSNTPNNPNVSDATATYEVVSIQLGAGGLLTQSGIEAYTGSFSAQLVSNGSTQYMYTIIPCSVSTAYVAQCEVTGPNGVVVQIQAVENGVTLGSNTVTCTGLGTWKLLSLASFTTDSSNPSFQIQMFPTTSSTIYADAVMVQKTNGAVTNYIDGNQGTGYAWTGVPNDSTSTYTAYLAQAASNQQSRPQFGALIDWTKALNPGAQFFTINQSTIGGSDFIPGTQTYPTYYDQYAYTDYSDYLLSVSIQKSLGQYPYGIFGGQMTMVLDNTSLKFLPGEDPVIGNYIINGRPTAFNLDFGGASVPLFTGVTTKPQNDLQQRTTTLISFDGTDYLNNFQTQGAGPVAAANGGVYVNVRADLIIADLLAEAGFSANQYVLDQSLQATPIGYLAPVNYQSQSGGNTGTIGAIIADICAAEQAVFFFDEAGVARFWNYQHFSTLQTPVWTFDYTNIIDFKLEDTPIINNVIVEAQPRVVQAKQLIWQQTSATSIPAPTTTAALVNDIINPTFLQDVANWSVTGGTLTWVSSPSFNASGAAQLVSTGPTQYMSQSIGNFSSAVSASCYVYAPSNVTVVLNAVVSGNSVASNSIVGNGAWQLITLQNFNPGGTVSIQIYPTSSATIYVDDVMFNPGISANSYFDGNTAAGTNGYVYSWSGPANESGALATPCGAVTITANFQDTYGSMPVTSVDLPVYVGNTPLTSNYNTNLNADGSGLSQNTSVSIASHQLSGSTYTITFVNTYTQPVFITAMSLYGTPAKVTQNISQQFVDTNSETLYGTNPSNNGQPLVIQNNLIQDQYTALSDAYMLVHNYSQPYQRMMLDVFSMPALQFGDTVYVHIEDTNQTLPYTIIGLTNGINNDGEIIQSLELNLLNIVHYFTIGVSQIGGTDSIAP